MIDFYKQEIEKVAMEKIAARAWKKFLPKLSDKNYNRLLQSGVYNPDKELSGIERGTQAILNRYDKKIIRKPNKAGGAAAEMVKRDAKQNGEFLSNAEINYYKNMPKNEMSGFSATPPTKQSTPYNATGTKNGFVFIPKNTHNESLRANPQWKEETGFKPFSRRQRVDNKWNQALTERHEADEARYGTINRRKGIADNTSYSSHASPKVLSQESANMAIMPRSVKNTPIKDFRNNTGEARVMEHISGVPYASSGVYNKRAAKKAENYIINHNRMYNQ